MPEITIAGKKVLFRERLPAGEFYGILPALNALGGLDREPVPPERIQPLMGVVETWEFPGNPGEVAAWASLDLFREYLPLLSAIGSYLGDITAGLAELGKNSAGPPTLP